MGLKVEGVWDGSDCHVQGIYGTLTAALETAQADRMNRRQEEILHEDFDGHAQLV